MQTASRPRFRFQYSLRTLFAVTAIVALLLVPVAWVARERQRMLEAREAALRAVILAERDRTLALQTQYSAERRTQSGIELPRAEESSGQNAGGLSESIAGQVEKAPSTRAPTFEQLLRENAELKETVEKLRREIERLERERMKDEG